MPTLTGTARRYATHLDVYYTDGSGTPDTLLKAHDLGGKASADLAASVPLTSAEAPAGRRFAWANRGESGSSPLSNVAAVPGAPPAAYRDAVSARTGLVAYYRRLAWVDGSGVEVPQGTAGATLVLFDETAAKRHGTITGAVTQVDGVGVAGGPVVRFGGGTVSLPALGISGTVARSLLMRIRTTFAGDQGILTRDADPNGAAGVRYTYRLDETATPGTYAQRVEVNSGFALATRALNGAGLVQIGHSLPAGGGTTDIAFYEAGAPDPTSSSGPRAINTNPGPWVLGQGTGTAANLAGDLAELQFYSRVLTAQEMADDHAAANA